LLGRLSYSLKEAAIMITRRALTLMVATSLGLASFGILQADDPKPIIPQVMAPGAQPNPPLIPMQAAPPTIPSVAAPTPQATPMPVPPVMPMAPAATKEPVAIEKQIEQGAQNLKPGQKQVWINVTCVEMGPDIISEIGLTADRPKNMENSSLLVTCLSPRERKMLEALVRAKQKQGEIDIISRPQMCIADGEAGFCQVGQVVPTGHEISTKDGKSVPQVTYMTVGLTTKVTPKISKDNCFISLRLEQQRARVVDLANASENLALPVPVEAPEKAEVVQARAKEAVENTPATTFESVQITTSVTVPTGGAAVIGKRVEPKSTIIQKKNMLTGAIEIEHTTTNSMFLWIVTAHAVVGKP
jgi:hypothetical protein